MRRVASVVGTVVLLIGLAAPPASAQTDAVSVARALINAENAHNVTAAVNFFAPGAVVSLPTGALVTRAEIEQWQRELAAGNFHAETTTPVAVTPEVVTFSGTVALDLFRGLGISSLDATWQLTIQLGQVTTFVFDFTPAASARLGAALAGGSGGAAGGGAASAGGGGSGTQAGSSATASAGRSLALTGADLGLAGVGLGAVAMGALLVLAGRRRRWIS